MNPSRLPRFAPHLLLAGYLAAAVALLASSPPGSAPDEYAHYLKAAGAGRGQIVLTRDPPSLVWPEAGPQTRFLDTQDKLVSLPVRLGPYPIMCWTQPFYVGGCPDINPRSSELADFPTYVARYPPYGYLAPGLAMRPANTVTQALYLGRLAGLAVAMALLAAAVAAIDDRDNPLSLIGLVAALTPMVLYLLGVLSSSGLEIAAGICFPACLLRLTRPGIAAPRWVWWAAAVSGSLLALTRELGPLWVAMAAGAALLLAGFRRTREVVAAHGRRALASGAVLALSIAGALAWQAAQGAGGGWAVDARALRRAGDWLPEVAHQAVGMFGALDAPVPEPVLHLWWAILGIVVAIALAAGRARERVVLLLSMAGAVALAMVADAIQIPTGFRAQARHLMPALTLVPLLAGEIATRHRDRLRPVHWAMPVTAGLAAIALMLGWRTLAHRYAGGGFRDPQWVPAGGWPIWGILMAVGVMLILAAAYIKVAAWGRTEQG